MLICAKGSYRSRAVHPLGILAPCPPLRPRPVSRQMGANSDWGGVHPQSAQHPVCMWPASLFSGGSERRTSGEWRKETVGAHKAGNGMAAGVGSMQTQIAHHLILHTSVRVPRLRTEVGGPCVEM
ncbi:hypothetical protein EI94DRAFT_845336 [Lactarius quietus]|nr:hypothetical protein EI94DRAFT_845336 [Lactarius quietus]